MLVADDESASIRSQTRQIDPPVTPNWHGGLTAGQPSTAKSSAPIKVEQSSGVVGWKFPAGAITAV